MAKSVKQKGFSLIEIMMALTLFAIFATAFIASQGYNVRDSMMLEDELKLARLCINKINEIYIFPPEFKESLELSKEKKAFKTDPNYEYEIEYKKLKIPDIFQLSKGDEEEKSSKNKGLEKMIVKKMKKNIEKTVWQVRVTVRNKETDFTYSLSSWITDPKKQMELNIGF